MAVVLPTSMPPEVARLAKHPYMEDEDHRMNTFDTFPVFINSNTKDMAEAGLFYCKFADCVRCYYCGGGLRNWEPLDVPKEVHAQWYPMCAFLRNKFGDEYVNECQRRNPHIVEDEVPYEPQPIIQKPVLIDSKPSNPTSNAVQATVTEIDDTDKENVIKTLLEMNCRLVHILAAIKEKEENSNNKNYTAMSLLPLVCQYESDELTVGRSIYAQLLEEEPAEEEETDLINALPMLTISDNLTADQPPPPKPHKKKGTPKQYLALKTENLKLKDQIRCKICLDRPCEMLFMPCMHLIACAICAEEMKKCGICRRMVQSMVKVYS